MIGRPVAAAQSRRSGSARCAYSVPPSWQRSVHGIQGCQLDSPVLHMISFHGADGDVNARAAVIAACTSSTRFTCEGEGITKVRCDCGAVELTVTADPAEINDCHVHGVSGGRTGAYYRTNRWSCPLDRDSTSVYLRAARRLEFHRCKVCNLTTRWVNIDRAKRKEGRQRTPHNA